MNRRGPKNDPCGPPVCMYLKFAAVFFQFQYTYSCLLNFKSVFTNMRRNIWTEITKFDK